MKKVLYFFVMAMIMIGITSCDQKPSLKQVVEEAKKDCPEKIEVGIYWTDMFLEGKDVVYLYELNEDFYDINLIRLNSTEIRKDLFTDTDDDEVRDFLEICYDENADVIFRYKGDQSGDTYDIRLNKSDIGDILGK